MYLDHAATTPMRPGVWEAMAPFADDVFGNASGSHALSRRAKNALEEARERVAAILRCAPGEIVFTGGGTEADNLAVVGRSLPERRHIVTSAVEHEAVLESVEFCRRMGAETTVVGVDRNGIVDPDEVGRAVTAGTGVVSVMFANNETGVLQPVGEIVERVGGRAPVHTDAVQAFASHRIEVDDLGADLVSLAAHKFGGPKGVGVLFVRGGVALEPLIHGGGQELGRRSGTSNVMGAVGMATAMELASADRARFVTDVTAARLAFEEVVIAGGAVGTLNAPALPQHCHVRFPGVRNETVLVRLDRLGVAASAGSACASGAATVSHVLEAMGLSVDDARASLRFSFGWTTTIGEAVEAAGVVVSAVEGA